MGNKQFYFFIGILLLLLAVATVDVKALPIFARKYGVSCMECHTAIPKLNRDGYEFRLAGFRMPNELNKAEEKKDADAADKEDKTSSPDLNNFFAADIIYQYGYVNHRDAIASNNDSIGNPELAELALRPLTGAWNRNFSSETEIDFSPDGGLDVGQAYVRGVSGDSNGWWQARVGVMNLWEGFGASDRSMSNIAPLFLENPAKGSPLSLGGSSQSGLEVGYYSASFGTALAFKVTNGILWSPDGSGGADPAQGGNFSKIKDTPGWNQPAYQLTLTQFLTNDAGITLYGYYGEVPYPDPNYNATSALSTISSDKYQRLAAYANYWVWPSMVNLLGGYEYGYDSLSDVTASSTDGIYNGGQVGVSNGYFAEFDHHILPQLAWGARYDYVFNPVVNVPGQGATPISTSNQDSMNAYTVMLDFWTPEGVILQTDYHHVNTLISAGTNQDDQVTSSMMFIW